jgi:hypothetical protein
MGILMDFEHWGGHYMKWENDVLARGHVELIDQRTGNRGRRKSDKPITSLGKKILPDLAPRGQALFLSLPSGLSPALCYYTTARSVMSISIHTYTKRCRTSSTTPRPSPILQSSGMHCKLAARHRSRADIQSPRPSSETLGGASARTILHYQCDNHRCL